MPEARAIVTFEALTEDSRCPQGAACAWAGEAKVGMAVTIAPDAKSSFPLVLGADSAAQSHTNGGYRLTLRAVTPTPNAARSTPPADIRAELQLDRVP